ncbi:MAG TPA: BatA and WFA domain-containing protein [Abditibacteriaceae bacterium]|jgi:hypothetical protein
MNLISPQNFLFAGLIGIVVLLYVLRLKRREHVVSSTMLWQTALRDLQANSPWQKLRSSLLMWLQIAFLVLAVLALVRPALRVLTSGGQNIAIIVDASGSMAATDVRPSRFERARGEANRLINALSTGDSATVISAGSQTRVLASLTSDKNVLKRAVSGASTQDTNANLREAIVLAGSLLRGKNKNTRGAQIYVLSDGAVPEMNDLSTGDIGLQFVKIGSGNDNLAITAMDVRRGYATGSDYQIFATVRNFSKQPRTVNLELLHEGNLVAVRPLQVAANGQQSQLFENTGLKQGLFSVRFDADDDLQRDNIAYTTLEPQRAIRVLLISEGNLFLERALNVDPNVELFRTSASAYSTAKTGGEYDVIVCDGAAPANLPAGNQLLFNTFTDMAPVVKGGIAPSPSVADWDRKHPVTRFAPWNDIRLAQAQAVQLKPWGQALVEAERTPLIVGGERGGRRVVWCGFDLRESDLPLRVAFPIFITNTLHWLTAPRGATSTQEGAPLRAGDPVPLSVPAGTKEIIVTAPDKSRQRVPVQSTPVMFAGADQVGVYTAETNDQSGWKKTFAVNLLNSSESNLTPRDALQVSGGKQVQGETGARSNRELWGYIALAALLLLTIEWWVYHRGV